jgi:acyl dehydratase
MNSMSTLDDLKKLVGVEGKPLTIKIEKGMVKNFAEAIGDTNPIWQDEEYAQKSKYGGAIVPPGLFCALMMFVLPVSEAKKVPSILAEMPLESERVLDAGTEWEFILPVRIGEVITSTTKLVNVRGREGKMGKMLFLVAETIFKNQSGEAVAKSRATFAYY